MCQDGDDDEARALTEIDARILDVFADGYCNKHLMYSALELVLVRAHARAARRAS